MAPKRGNARKQEDDADSDFGGSHVTLGDDEVPLFDDHGPAADRSARAKAENTTKPNGARSKGRDRSRKHRRERPQSESQHRSRRRSQRHSRHHATQVDEKGESRHIPTEKHGKASKKPRKTKHKWPGLLEILFGIKTSKKKSQNETKASEFTKLKSQKKAQTSKSTKPVQGGKTAKKDITSKSIDAQVHVSALRLIFTSTKSVKKHIIAQRREIRHNMEAKAARAANDDTDEDSQPLLTRPRRKQNKPQGIWRAVFGFGSKKHHGSHRRHKHQRHRKHEDEDGEDETEPSSSVMDDEEDSGFVP